MSTRKHSMRVIEEEKPSGAMSSIEDKFRVIREALREEYLSPHIHPWIVGLSGGKDSTLVLQLVFEMLLSLPPSHRNRQVHALVNDTLVESPVLTDHVDSLLARIGHAAIALRVPIKAVKTSPPLKQSFWVNLIGRGYAAPTRNFRWCTDRMKIQPTASYIEQNTRGSGNVILVLGVRSAESSARARSVAKHASGTRLSAHKNIRGCLVFNPIADLSTSEVWQYLLQCSPPWGGSHRNLVTLYRNAQGGECPLVMDKEDAPSCGSKSSRFGCWTCTVVSKDKSAEALVESGYGSLEPLLQFRDKIVVMREDQAKRMATRRNGRVMYKANGSIYSGPFTLAARSELLTELLELQVAVNRRLITDEEVAIIKRIWSHDAAAEVERRQLLTHQSQRGS